MKKKIKLSYNKEFVVTIEGEDKEKNDSLNRIYTDERSIVKF